MILERRLFGKRGRKGVKKSSDIRTQPNQSTQPAAPAPAAPASAQPQGQQPTPATRPKVVNAYGLDPDKATPQEIAKMKAEADKRIAADKKRRQEEHQKRELEAKKRKRDEKNQQKKGQQNQQPDNQAGQQQNPQPATNQQNNTPNTRKKVGLRQTWNNMGTGSKVAVGASVGLGALGLGYAAKKWYDDRKRQNRLRRDAEDI